MHIKKTWKKSKIRSGFVQKGKKAQKRNNSLKKKLKSKKETKVQIEKGNKT